MATYASKTEVSASKSRAEIERTLTRYGADQFMYGWDGDKAVIQFRMQNRFVRFIVPLPARDSREITHHSRGRRTKQAAQKAYDQAVRQRWRALALVIKAKLEAVEASISEFEHEFMANIVMPDGQTVADHIVPRIAEAYETGAMPKLLPTG